ncbi:MAG TPA: Ig-like domain-containing protein, partial [Candidatus Dormibacteraeota bacterium]|nr:Ig-like domain-containing protein [Candidatus Dormibacteraeota bacterium]
MGEGPPREREGPGKWRLVAAAGGLTILLPLTACGGNPPQIVDYSPQRGAVEVSTAAPIKIAFDHAVDQ